MPDADPTLTYRGAGVDIEAGSRLVDGIRPLAAATRRAGTKGSLEAAGERVVALGQPEPRQGAAVIFDGALTATP